MKRTIKIGILSALLVSYTLASKAQDATTHKDNPQEWRISVGPDAGVPVGQFSNAYNWNFGGSAQVDIPILHKLYVTVNAGYEDFFVKKNQADVTQRNLQLVPVKAGFKWFFVGNLLYVQGQAGVAFVGNKSDLDADNSAIFDYAPQVGVLLKLAPKNYLDLGVRFEGMAPIYKDGSYNNFLGLRAAYAFGL